MIWEKVGKAYISGPFSIVRYGFKFKLIRNGEEIGLYPTIVKAKLAAVCLDPSTGN